MSYILQAIAFLGLFTGCLLRQIIPFALLLLRKKELHWEHTYTRRFIWSLLVAFILAYTESVNIVLNPQGILATFVANCTTGVCMNWLIELASKLEWEEGANHT